jgi:hypothetical protein
MDLRRLVPSPTTSKSHPFWNPLYARMTSMKGEDRWNKMGTKKEKKKGQRGGTVCGGVSVESLMKTGRATTSVTEKSMSQNEASAVLSIESTDMLLQGETDADTRHYEIAPAIRETEWCRKRSWHEALNRLFLFFPVLPIYKTID